MNIGDLTFWYGRNTIALVIDVELENGPEKNGRIDWEYDIDLEVINESR